MGSTLDDLLQRASKLSKSVVQQRPASARNADPLLFSQPSPANRDVASFAHEAIAMEQEEVNLKEIFNRSESLRQAKAHARGSTLREGRNDEIRTNLLFADDGGLGLGRLPRSVTKTEPVLLEDDRSTHVSVSGPPGGLSRFLHTEREKALACLIDESLDRTMQEVEHEHWTRIATEWQAHKKSLFRTMLADPAINTTIPGTTARRFQHSEVRPSAMNREQLLFAQKLTEFVDNGKTQSLVSLFTDAIASLRDTSKTEMWAMVTALLETRLQAGVSVKQQRASQVWIGDAVRRATGYLERHFCQFQMELLVRDNLEKARRGGVPGTIATVQAYLNVKLSTPAMTPQTIEDGLYEGRHPLWMVVFYCLRSGDARAAHAVAQSCRGAGDVIAALDALSNHRSPSTDLLTTINLSLKRRTDRVDVDLYKRSVYSILAGLDTTIVVSQIAEESLEDWLWLKLMQCRVTDNVQCFGDLQRLIAITYGEKHFAAGSSPLMFFNALWLTGQFEIAIEFLSRQDAAQLVQAVHIAIVTHRVGLLLLPAESTAKLLTKDSVNDTVAYLNFARLILQYTTRFEATNPEEAVFYFSLLSNIPSGDNLLHVSIARLVRVTKEYDRLLGRWEETADGGTAKRLPGCIARLGLDVCPIIAHVAREAETAGDVMDAVKLFDLAEQSNEAVRLLNRRLSQMASRIGTGDLEADAVRELAVALASRYRRHSRGRGLDAQLSSTFFLLIDLCTFFELVVARQFEKAVDVMRQLRAVPLKPEDVDACVAMFHMVPEEVRRLLPDILLALMSITVELYNAGQQLLTQAETGQLEEERQRARAVIEYAGMIPYRLPADINARLIQMAAMLT